MWHVQRTLFLSALLFPAAWAQTPAITLVANAEGENPVIAPNTWVEIKGSNLSKPGDSRIWQTSDFVNSQLPTTLDGVSVTVGGRSAYVYYTPSQVHRCPTVFLPDRSRGNRHLADRGRPATGQNRQAVPGASCRR
jgi:uncharacterized protein (TIGR03437 family)